MPPQPNAAHRKDDNSEGGLSVKVAWPQAIQDFIGQKHLELVAENDGQPV